MTRAVRSSWPALALIPALACVATDADTEATRPDAVTTPHARPLTDVVMDATPERLARGRYLASAVTMCIRCHSEPDTTRPGWPALEGREGAGRVVWEREDGERLVAPNLTPDAETGAGTWPDDALARAIREGVGHDGRALSRPMYWESFRNLSDEDVASIIVYLRSLPAIRNPLPRRVLSPAREADLAEDPSPLTGPVAEPDLADPVERGRYLVRVTDCIGCHTAWYADPRPGVYGGGNRIEDGFGGIEEVFSSNITPDVSGIGEWDAAFFIEVMRTGKVGTLSPAMPWVVFGRMTDEDLTAVFRALQDVPPVRHWVSSSFDGDYCELCQQEHGLGALNRRVPLVPAAVSTEVLEAYEGVYVHADGSRAEVRRRGGRLLIIEGADSVEAIPISGTRFQFSDVPDQLEFERSAEGDVDRLRYFWDGFGQVFLRER